MTIFTENAARFTSEEDGSATIEAVLWLPFFILVFVMILDATMIFANHSRVTRIVQDANRAYAVGALTSCGDLEDWVEERVQVLSPNASATCTRSGGVTIASVAMPSGELDLSGATGVFGGLTITVETQHLIEPGA